MGPFLCSQGKGAARHGHSYALSENGKCEKPFEHSVAIFGVLNNSDLSLEKSWIQSVKELNLDTLLGSVH